MYQRFMCEQDLAHLFSISLNCKESNLIAHSLLVFFVFLQETQHLTIWDITMIGCGKTL